MRRQPQPQPQRQRQRQRTGLVAVECLESRRLMAGNVSFTLDAAEVWQIIGDNQSNAVDFEYVDGAITVTGLNGTTVNGAAFATLPTPVATASVNFDMGNGDDFVAFDQDTLGGGIVSMPVTITTGKGHDTVSCFDWTFEDGLSIDTGKGNDTVRLEDVGIDSAASIDTGKGSDSVIFGGSIAGNGSLTIDGGNGADSTSGIALVGGGITQTIIEVETVG